MKACSKDNNSTYKAERAHRAAIRQQMDAVHRETEQLPQEEKDVGRERQIRTSERKVWRGRKRSSAVR